MLSNAYLKSVKKSSFMPLWPWRAGGIERSGCPSVDQVNIFSSPVRNTRRAIAVTLVVRVRVRIHVPFTLRQSFIFKFSKSSYLDSHSSESIHIWTIDILEGRVDVPGWG